eukprot:GHVQ01014222.1.p1 GENE.GHVQ01014222.1~~GHVQ01014222.1.p1  ORF type:complete len:253 (+),score=52.84 GHVQ01014222.1:715-1473(+)
MGNFCVYEFLRLLRDPTITKTCTTTPSQRVTDVRCLLLSCCLSPDTPEKQRPWRKSSTLSDAELKAEARKWDVNEAVFDEGTWEIYGKLFRADFPLFDSYTMTTVEKGGEPLGVDAVCWYAERDTMISGKLMEGWKSLLCKGDDNQQRAQENGVSDDMVNGGVIEGDSKSKERENNIINGGNGSVEGTERGGGEGREAGNEREKEEGGVVKPNRFEIRCLKGANHSFLYDVDIRAKWMTEAVAVIKDVLQGF